MSTGKAFTQPSAAKIEQQRKILEALEQQKKQMKTSSAGSNISETSSMLPTTPASTVASNMVTGNPAPPTTVGGQTTAPQSLPIASNIPDTLQSNQQMSSNQRKALEEANKTSFGFFIPQDSSFGNLILPVIPRIPPQPTPVSTTPQTALNTS